MTALAWLRVASDELTRGRVTALVSRVLGRAGAVVMVLSGIAAALLVVREAQFGRQFGAGADADAFFIAFLIASTLVFVIGGGTLSAVVPNVLERGQSTVDPRVRAATSGALLTISGMALVAVSVVVGFTAPWIVNLGAPGAARQTKVIATITLTALAPSILASGQSAVMARILQSSERFLLAGIGPVLAALPPIACLSAMALGLLRPSTVVVSFAIVAGAVVQLAVYLLGGRDLLLVPPRALLLAQGRAVTAIALPLLMYQTLAYFNVLWERGVASQLNAGSISELGYAMRLFSLLSTFLIAPLSSVFFGRYARRANVTAAHASGYLFTWLLRALVIGGGGGIILVVAGHFAIRLLYGSRFGPATATMVDVALSGYALGAAPMALAAFLVAAATGGGRIWLPVTVSLVDVIVYPVTVTLLGARYGILGIASSRAISFWLVFLLLLLLGRNYWKLSGWQYFVIAAGLAVAVIVQAATLIGLQWQGGVLGLTAILIGVVFTWRRRKQREP